ncbi:MAG TPA: NUDIX domain-containing protein [Lentimicrobium sp.]|nr:NUDIX domain-containing protein [Lentimicrobium sp.]
MVKNSAGILLYRKRDGELQVLLVHPGGPYWYKKDDGVWSIPKGEIDGEEGILDTAIREFEEETGYRLSGIFMSLNPVKLKSGKVIYAFALEGEIDPDNIHSNNFSMEWPPLSGKFQEFPEVDKAAWFDIEIAARKINQGQVPLLEELKDKS